MRTLVLIDNNLEQDNRVKRHIAAMLEWGQRVTVIADPLPSATPGMKHDRMQMIFWPQPEITLQGRHLRDLALRTKTLGFIFRAFPAALANLEHHARLGPMSRRIQQQQIACSRWDRFRGFVCREDLDPLTEHRSLMAYFEYMLNWAHFTVQREADLVYCNDLPSLLAGVAHKLCHGSRLIFDAHEIYYDMVPGALSRSFKESMAILESSLAWLADCVLGVSESHADWMRRTYDLARQVLCVPNCFGMGQAVDPPPERVPGTPLRIYYHGASDPYRGLTKLVRGLALVSDVDLVLRCPPSATLTEAREIAQTLGIASRVHFLPLVPPERMIEAIRAEGDVGIHACEPPTALNIKVGLTNKFIEYLMAGIPVITAPLEEQALIVRQYDIGYVLPDNTPEEIARSLTWAKANRDRLPALGQRAYRAGVERFSWPAIRRTLAEAFTESFTHERQSIPPGHQPRLDGGKLAAA
jgi:glycosyltransferase involved in cell wall biosynthesis